jgi:hypothetical protein
VDCLLAGRPDGDSHYVFALHGEWIERDGLDLDQAGDGEGRQSPMRQRNRGRAISSKNTRTWLRPGRRRRTALRFGGYRLRASYRRDSVQAALDRFIIGNCRCGERFL